MSPFPSGNGTQLNEKEEHEPTDYEIDSRHHVLAMNGEKDLQVLCELNLDPIEKALREGSPASFEVVRLPKMNHMFQETDGTGTPTDTERSKKHFRPRL